MISSLNPPQAMRRLLFPALLTLLQTSLLILILSHGWELSKDSDGYIQGSVLRSPVYPLLIAACRRIFGDAGLAAVVFIQTVLAALAVAAVAAFVRYRLRAGSAAALAAALILDFPVAFSRVATRILTEGVAYPLFLMTFLALAEAWRRRSARWFMLHLALAGLTTLTRPQFLFIFAISALAIPFVGARRPRRRRAVLAAALAAGLAFTWLADCTYHWIRHDHFGNVPFTGLQLMGGAVYVAQEGDAALFTGAEAELFRDVYQQAAQAGNLAADNPRRTGFGTYARHFTRVYNDIVWDVVRVSYETRFGSGDPTSIADRVEMDQVLNHMALRLILANPWAYARLYVSNVANGLDATTFLLLFGMAAVGARLGWFGSLAGPVLALAMVLHLANAALVALFEPAIQRYLFHTEYLVFALVPAFLVSLARLPPESPDDVRPRR